MSCSDTEPKEARDHDYDDYDTDDVENIHCVLRSRQEVSRRMHSALIEDALDGSKFHAHSTTTTSIVFSETHDVPSSKRSGRCDRTVCSRRKKNYFDAPVGATEFWLGSGCLAGPGACAFAPGASVFAMPPVVVGAIVVLLLELSVVSGRLAGPGTCAFAPGASVFVAPPAIGASVELLEFDCALATNVLIATATAVNINVLDNMFSLPWDARQKYFSTPREATYGRSIRSSPSFTDCRR
jgi:hypothetical protein